MHCDWLQPRATLQKNEHAYFWSQSHDVVVIVNDGLVCAHLNTNPNSKLRFFTAFAYTVRISQL